MTHYYLYIVPERPARVCNTKSIMNQRKLRKKVALLKSGQIVEINGNYFGAIRINDDDPQKPCLYCNVDCLCHGDVAEVCTELDFMSKSVWYLNLKA